MKSQELEDEKRMRYLDLREADYTIGPVAEPESSDELIRRASRPITLNWQDKVMLALIFVGLMLGAVALALGIRDEAHWLVSLFR